MTRTLDAVNDTLRSNKHPFRALANQPAKAKKNRYERRKIKEFIRVNDWTDSLE
jgi:hypothetical protein